MALNVTIFPRMQLRHGQFPPVLPLNADVKSIVVELGVVSEPIPAGSCLRLLADEDMRLAWSLDVLMPAPVFDAMKLRYGVPERFELPEGVYPYYLRVAAA